MQESDGGMAGGCDKNDLRVLYGEKQIFFRIPSTRSLPDCFRFSPGS